MITYRLEPTKLRCKHAVLFERHGNWWLVAFPEANWDTTTVYRLTGRMTARLTKRAMPDANLEEFPHGRAPIASPEPYWAGEFILSLMLGSDIFDLEGYGRRVTPTEEHMTVGQALVDSRLRAIPAPFIPVFQALPPETIPVLAIRESNDDCSAFELVTACYVPSHFPQSPWRALSNHSIGDSGSAILGWMHAADWIQPR